MAWAELNYHIVHSKSEVLEQILWWNSDLRIAGNPVVYKKWVEKGIWRVKDLVQNDGTFKEPQDLGVNWLEYKGLVQSIPELWKFWLNDPVKGDTSPVFEQLSLMQKHAKGAYNLLIEDSVTLLKYLDRWATDGIHFEEELYRKAFLVYRKSTQIMKLLDFQYRLLLNKIVTNNDLYKWGISNEELCTFCKGEPETTAHILCHCSTVKPIIECYFDICDVKRGDVHCNLEYFLLNLCNDNNNSIVNFVSIHLKQFIYRNRCQNIQITHTMWLKELRKEYEIQLFNAKRSYTESNLHQKWSPITNQLKHHWSIT